MNAKLGCLVVQNCLVGIKIKKFQKGFEIHDDGGKFVCLNLKSYIGQKCCQRLWLNVSCAFTSNINKIFENTLIILVLPSLDEMRGAYELHLHCLFIYEGCFERFEATQKSRGMFNHGKTTWTIQLNLFISLELGS